MTGLPQVRRPQGPAIPSVIRDCPRAADGMDWLYSYYTRDDELLYVGISLEPASRAAGHRSASKWWRFVADGDVVAAPASRSEMYERECIQIFEPLFNEVHRCYGYETVVEFCGRHQAWDIVDDFTDLISFGTGEPAELACAALGRRFPYSLYGAEWPPDPTPAPWWRQVRTWHPTVR